MTDSRLHIQPTIGRGLCGVSLTNRRYLNARNEEVAHAIWASADVCAECIEFYKQHIVLFPSKD